MAIFSENLLLSDDQAVTASAASTNLIDLGAMGTVYGAAAALERDLGRGAPINFLIQATEAATAVGAATVQFAIEVDDNASFSSAKVVAQSAAVGKADLIAGWQWNVQYLPKGIDERYMRVYYTVTTGPLTAGKFTAGITMGNQDDR